MNISLLKSLMRLFALVKNSIQLKGSKGDNIVESYLRNSLKTDNNVEYLNIFRFYDQKLYRDFKPADKRLEKTITKYSIKIILICELINSELSKNQKVILTTYLLEFIKLKTILTYDEIDIIDTITYIFQINNHDYENCKNFILSPFDDIKEIEKILCISDMPEPGATGLKHLHRSHLNGKIFLLFLEEANLFIFRYIGNNSLVMEAQIIQVDKIYFLSKGGAIRGPKIQTIYFGEIEKIFLLPANIPKIKLTAYNIEYKFENSEAGIKKFSALFETGQLVGIMGASGTGKTTLLHLLSGIVNPDKGNIFINGENIKSDKNELKGIIGFIPQDDLLFEELTVYQNLYYNAQLCFKDLSENEICNLVEITLKSLDLYEIKDLRVGDPLNKYISGGQRKRLNIALELIREPYILFIDEPTSGLSSMDSLKIMELLKIQTIKGKIVIINIHQPSSEIYRLFDKLVILDKGGYPIYTGNPIDAILYFKDLSFQAGSEISECKSCGYINPNLIFEIIEEKSIIDSGEFSNHRKLQPLDWYHLYQENIESKKELLNTKSELPTNHFKIPGKFKQFKIFSLRNILSKLTDNQYLIINFSEAPLLALVLGYFSKYIPEPETGPAKYLFSENVNLPSYLFMSIVVFLFLGLSVSAEEIIKDRKILMRESFLNLSRFSYLNSKILLLFIISAIQAFTFVLIGNSILEIKGMYFNYWLVLFTTSCFANMLGLNISASLNSVVAVYIIVPLLLIPQLLLSGVIVKFDKLFKPISSYEYVPLVGDLMASRWALEAMIVEQFKNNEYENLFYEIEQRISDLSYGDSYLIPEILARVYKINEKDTSLSENDFKFIENQLIKLKLYKSIIRDKMGIDLLDKLTVSSKAGLMGLSHNIELIKNIMIKEEARLQDKKSTKIESMMKQYRQKKTMLAYKNSYVNFEIEDLVLRRKEMNRTITLGSELVRLYEPIYMIPVNTNGRAHFYAPYKKVGNYYIETMYFNITAIWLMSLILYITLINNSLRKIIETIGNLTFPFKKQD